jgi:hypothetical protein
MLATTYMRGDAEK